MKDLQALLRDGDPARVLSPDDELSAMQAAAIRRQIVLAARRPEPLSTAWHQPLAVAAMVALTVAAGVVAGRRLALPEPVFDAPRRAPTAERRQFQFSTPGGTRIIWVFDSEFQMKETVP